MKEARWIFSHQWKYRFSRHIIFWLVYGTIFFIQSLVPRSLDDFFYSDIYLIALTSTVCFLPTCLYSSYMALYVVWPFFLKRKRYSSALALFVLIFATAILINYVTSGWFQNSYYVRTSGRAFGSQLGLGYLNAIWAITVMAVALAIRVGKACYIQKKENVNIARRSMRTQIDVEKSKLRPAYLYNSLNHIQDKTQSDFEASEQMILKLSDFLNYTLYECDVEFVPLDTEIAALIDFIELEKLKTGSENIVLNWETVEHLAVPPMMILAFLQEVVMLSRKSEDCEWQLFLHVRGDADEIRITAEGWYSDGMPDLSHASDNLRHRLQSVFADDLFSVIYRADSNKFNLFVSLMVSDVMYQQKNAV